MRAVYSLLPLALYLAAAALQVRAAGRDRTAPARLPLAVALLGFAAHSFILFSAIRTPQGVALAIADSASLVGWVVAGTTLVAMAALRLAALPAPLLGLAGLLAIGTGVAAGFRETHLPQWEIKAHISLAALAAGWLSIAALVVMLIALQDTRLRARRPLGALALLPPVETMESLLFRALAGGFVVLTLALVTGSFFVEDLVAQHLVHKVSLALTAWLIFGVLLWGRWKFGWRGRQALRFTLTGFVVLALAYFGSKFVLENLLGRHWG
jgi:ABC-type uncharacterized transport system permease subunit